MIAATARISLVIVSEVIRAAIRGLQSEEEDKAKVEALRVAIAEGLQGTFLDGPTVNRASSWPQLAAAGSCV
jgi:hypothetical protein